MPSTPKFQNEINVQSMAMTVFLKRCCNMRGVLYASTGKRKERRARLFLGKVNNKLGFPDLFHAAQKSLSSTITGMDNNLARISDIQTNRKMGRKSTYTHGQQVQYYPYSPCLALGLPY